MGHSQTPTGKRIRASKSTKTPDLATDSGLCILWSSINPLNKVRRASLSPLRTKGRAHDWPFVGPRGLSPGRQSSRSRRNGPAHPEEVFGVSRLGFRELVKFAIGPSLIALGISIGSGEWLLGPLSVGQFGFIGVGWVITTSAVLQTFYNVECSRYVLATGEVPVVGWGRVPPGWVLWVPFSVFIVIFAFIAGGWAATAGDGVYALVHGAVPAKGAKEPRIYAIALLVLVVLITAAARRISRALELANWVMVSTILLVLLMLDLIVVPGRIWWEAIRGFLTPAAPPAGITASQIGGLAGFTALASGLNWYVMGHYRDKGYGMGHRAGYLAGLRGEQKELLASGVTFPDDQKNRDRWRRWYRLLLIDMWGVFFVGAMLGMLLPTILMARAVEISGKAPTRETVPTFVADVLGGQYGSFVFYLTSDYWRVDPVQHPARHLRGHGAGDDRRIARDQLDAARPSSRTRGGSITRLCCCC